MKIRRSAYTLLELLVATAIFATIITVATISVGSATSLYTQEKGSQQEVALLQSIREEIGNNISNANTTPIIVPSIGGGSSVLMLIIPTLDSYGRPLPSGVSLVEYCIPGTTHQIVRITTPLVYGSVPGGIPPKTPCDVTGFGGGGTLQVLTPSSYIAKALNFWSLTIPSTSASAIRVEIMLEQDSTKLRTNEQSQVRPIVTRDVFNFSSTTAHETP